MASCVLATLLGLLLVIGASEGSYNKYGSNFCVRCPSYKGLGSFSSYYSSSYRDRKFQFKCDANVGYYHTSKDCYWTEYRNYNWQQYSLKTHTCPLNSVPTGVCGYYHSSYRDRRWQFRCCFTQKKFTNCYWKSHYVNDPGSYFSYSLPSDRVVKGYQAIWHTSFHGKTVYDRRWRVYLCHA